MARKIEIVAHDPEWETLFEGEAGQLRDILKKNCVAIHHIGSTAVNGLRSRPIIDCMAIVKDISRVSDEDFEALNYVSVGDNGVPGRRVYRATGNESMYQIFVYEEKSVRNIHRHLAVRDYLNGHPKDSAAYAALKMRLAEQFPNDADAYCKGKEEFLDELEEKAFLWQRQEKYKLTCMSSGMCLGGMLGAIVGVAVGGAVGLFIGVMAGLLLGMSAGLAFGSVTKEEQSAGT